MISFFVMALIAFITLIHLNIKVQNHAKRIKELVASSGYAWPYKHDLFFYLKIAFSSAMPEIINHEELAELIKPELKSLTDIRNKWILFSILWFLVFLVLLVIEGVITNWISHS